MIPDTKTKPEGNGQGACVAHAKALRSKRTGAIPDKGFQEEEREDQPKMPLHVWRQVRLTDYCAAGMQNF